MVGRQRVMGGGVITGMKPVQLQRYNGAAVEISVDGAEAVGILFFSEHNEFYVVSMCYTKRRTRCPLVQHVLSAEEIQTLTPAARNKLHSNIDVWSEEMAAEPVSVSAPASALCVEAGGGGSEDVVGRLERARERSRRLRAEFAQLKAEGTALAGKLRKVQEKLLLEKRKRG